MGMKKVVKNQSVGIKVMVFGESGCGKSFFGLTFPKIAAFDTELGLQFYMGKDIEIGGKIYNNLEFISSGVDIDEIEETLDEILDGEYDCKTVVIDSESKIHIASEIASAEVEERKAKMGGKATDTRAKWGRVRNTTMKLSQKKLTLSAKGYNYVEVCQQKELKDDNGKILGYQPVCHSTRTYDFDVVMRMYTEVDKKTNTKRYFAHILKDRTETFTPETIVENVTYDMFASAIEGRTGGAVDANFDKDLNSTKKSILSDSEKSTDLAEEIKALIKNNKEHISDIKKKLDEHSIDVKRLDVATPEVLMEIKKFIESL